MIVLPKKVEALPAAPVEGDVFELPDKTVWLWSGDKWIEVEVPND